MNAIEIKNLKKHYSAFDLDNVSFNVEVGKITGFIGRNGAGKTTTLKALTGFIHPDYGSISYFGDSFFENQSEIKKKISFVSGSANYYPSKKLKTITSITKAFYKDWDGSAYSGFIKLFNLDENKTLSQLSDGMKVKYSLTLGMSHKAKILILDEPTSGLDPVSRDDLLDVFMDLCAKGATILFSTHITSDLDKCADNIVYIKNGKILADGNLKLFIENYRLVSFADSSIKEGIASKLIGFKRVKDGFDALIKTKDALELHIESTQADIESIMVHIEKEAE